MIDFVLLSEISFRGTISPWLAYPLMGVAVLAAFLLYFRESLKMDVIQRIFMAMLRALVLILIIFLLRKPVLVDDVTGERPRPLALFVDNSQSMTQRDPRLNTADQVRVLIARGKQDGAKGLTVPDSQGDLPMDRPSRQEIVRAVLENPKLQLEQRLQTKGPMQYFLFGQRLRGIPNSPESPWLKQFQADESRTLIADSLIDFLQKDENELPTAIVVLTDGRDNGSQAVWEDLARECTRLKVPLHIYGVGGSATGYLQLKDVPVPDTLFVEDTVNVPFRWRSQGFKDGEIELSLTLNGKPVGQNKRLPVKEGDDIVDTVRFTPEKRDSEVNGKQELVATIRLFQGNEEFKDQIIKSVRVVDRKVKLLFVERAPRWEFKFMQRAFLRDRRVDPSFLIIEADTDVMNAGPPFIPRFPTTRKDLFAYDLLILGDVDPNYLTLEQKNWIRDYVTEGGGLVMLAGRVHAPGSYLNTPLAEVLPVDFQKIDFPIDANERTEEWKPQLTPLGERNAMMSLSDDPAENLHLWKTLPGWHWNYPVTKLRPGAVALLTHPRKTIADSKPMPLMAMHYYGKGLVLFVGTEETWRWRYNEADKYFARFWGQVVYQIGLPHTLGSKSAQLSLAEGEAMLGKPGQVYARLFTPDFLPLKTEKIAARLERLDAKPGEDRFQNVNLEAIPNQPGEYTATLAHDRMGRFALRVESGAEPATLEYRVNLPPEHELSPMSMNEEVLRKLAEQSGGKFYREENLHELPDNISTRMVQFTQRQELLLWTKWWVLAIVVALFTMEWILRKLSNLS